MRVHSDYLAGMVGSYALYIPEFGADKLLWAYRTVGSSALAEEIACKQAGWGRPIVVKKIDSIEEADAVDSMIQRYEDWASD